LFAKIKLVYFDRFPTSRSPVVYRAVCSCGEHVPRRETLWKRCARGGELASFSTAALPSRGIPSPWPSPAYKRVKWY